MNTEVKKKSMTQEQKELLLKDLCARLPYGVKVLCLRDFNHEWYNLEKVDIGNNELYVTTYESYENKYVEVEDVLPYLLPLTSMTIEEKRKSPFEVSMIDAWIDGSIYLFEDEELTVDEIFEMFDWFNKNHFDYRGLIEKGLAIDATNLNIY